MCLCFYEDLFIEWIIPLNDTHIFYTLIKLLSARCCCCCCCCSLLLVEYKISVSVCLHMACALCALIMWQKWNRAAAAAYWRDEMWSMFFGAFFYVSPIDVLCMMHEWQYTSSKENWISEHEKRAPNQTRTSDTYWFGWNCRW